MQDQLTRFAATAPLRTGVACLAAALLALTLGLALPVQAAPLP